MTIDHYENFPVASFLCPPRLRPAIVAIYHFARTADDIADEGDDPPNQRLEALRAYRADLDSIFSGQAPSSRWPHVFGPLRRTIEKHGLAHDLLADLLSAFEQDVVKLSYEDRADLLEYCRRSANPVGRLLLHLYGIGDTQSLRQSDAICTALQLANFWQDLSIDTHRGRLYIPVSDCARRGVEACEILGQQDSPTVRSLVADMIGWTREMMLVGAPLAHVLPGRAGWELRLVVQGGLRILERVEHLGFETLRYRPTLHWNDVALMAWRALCMRTPRAIVASRSA